MYGADALPLMLDQSVFSIRMRNTVRMVDDGCVVVVVLVVVVGGRVVVDDDVVVGGRVVVVVVEDDVVVGGRVVVVVVEDDVVVGGRVVVVVVDDVVVVGGRVVVVMVDDDVVVGGRVVVVVEAPGGVTVRLNVPCAPPYPSTTMKYACPAVTVGVMREARNRPLALAHASSLHPAAISGPLAQTPLRK